MAAPNVDIVLVVDTSGSMTPVIDQLCLHLRELIKPMQGYSSRVRFGLVSAGSGGGNELWTLVGEGVANLYSSIRMIQYDFFSDNPDKVIEALDRLPGCGNEHNLLALDVALDHPFGPTGNTKRVVALFSDEPFEGGACFDENVLPEIIDKIHRRRVKLFCALPESETALTLSQADGSEFEFVSDHGGLAGVDFKALLGQIGKSISASTLQSATDDASLNPLFGQDRF